jgi:signal transduction histidine kinase
VRAIANAHGGSARVRSVRGEGSEFEILLPAIPEVRAEA